MNALYFLKEARRKGQVFDWPESGNCQAILGAVGVRKLEADLDEVLSYFDWSPFFWSWQLKGQYPDIFDRGETGEEAKKLYEQAQTLLARIIEESLFKCEAVAGLWPAGSSEDGVTSSRTRQELKKLGAFHFLRRQQVLKNKPQFCLSDSWLPSTVEKPTTSVPLRSTQGKV